MDDLKKDTKSLTDEEQALQRDIDSYSAPDALQRRARELGMVPGGDPAFLNPDGTVKGVPSPAAQQSLEEAPAAVRPPEALLLSQTIEGPPSPATPSPSAPSEPTEPPAPSAAPTEAIPETPGR